jgi:glyoxylase-like metal-dependent hydrolase (beta-lactamase superfamily II)
MSVQEIPSRGWDSRVHVFHSDIGQVDAYAIVTERIVIIVDTFSLPKHAQEMVEQIRSYLENRFLMVVNTHADYDHCWGNAIFALAGGAFPAPIIGHQNMRYRLFGRESKELLEKKRQEDSQFDEVKFVEPTITFHDRFMLNGGDLNLEIIATPGHTSDHASVWIPELRLLLVGDAAESPFPYVAGAASLPLFFRSLQRMADLNPTMILPCHGNTTDPQLLDRNIAYFDAVARHCQEAHNTGLLADNWRKRDDLPELVNMSYEDALHLVGADPSSTADFYRDVHIAAIRATLEAQEPNM